MIRRDIIELGVVMLLAVTIAVCAVLLSARVSDLADQVNSLEAEIGGGR